MADTNKDRHCIESTSMPCSLKEKTQADPKNKMPTLPPHTIDVTLVEASWKMKLLIFMIMLYLPAGSHYLEATVGTLKTSIKTSLKINNTEFSILTASVTLVNTVLPLLAGTIVDDISGIGSVRGTLFISLMVFIGSLLVSMASIYQSYSMMVAGSVIYGLGGGMIVTMQEAVLSRWFRDKQLAIVIGLILASARLTKWVAKMACYPIVYATQSNAWPIHVATLLCGLGVIVNGMYWVVMYYHRCATLRGKEIAQPLSGYRSQWQSMDKKTDHSEKLSFQWSLRLLLLLPSTFWMIPWAQLLMSSIMSSFDDVATEYIQFRYKTTSIMAGYQSSLTQVMPIVFGPLMGVVVHRYGKRLIVLFIATLLLMTSMVLLTFTKTIPAVGMIIFSLALALGPVAILSSASLLLPHELSGTGMGLHKCSNNIGTTIVSVLVGYVQDLTLHDGDPSNDVADKESQYDGVMILYLTMACLSMLFTVLFWCMDRRLLSGWLEAGVHERNRRLQQVRENQAYGLYDKTALQRIGSRLRDTPTYYYVFFYGFWLLLAWVVFFTFALMPVYKQYDIK
ncbi:major facilitator superfamily domain-containing protein [Spinellus fusiger]|nr:major facilitator superfamily domain-containing protein [Spinellus fusiger]